MYFILLYGLIFNNKEKNILLIRDYEIFNQIRDELILNNNSTTFSSKRC